MAKIAGIGQKVVEYLNKKSGHLISSQTAIDIYAIKAKVREYFFTAKKKSIEVKRNIFREIHQLVKRQMRPIVESWV